MKSCVNWYLFKWSEAERRFFRLVIFKLSSELVLDMVNQLSDRLHSVRLVVTYWSVFMSKLGAELQFSNALMTTLSTRHRKTTELQLLEEYYFDDSEKGQSRSGSSSSSTWSPSPVTVRKSFLTFINIDQEIFHTTLHLILSTTWQYVSLQFVRLRRSSSPQSEDSFGVWRPQTMIQHSTEEDHWYITTPHQTLALHFSHFHIFPWTRSCLLAMNENQESVTCNLPTVLTHNSEEDISLKCSSCTMTQILASFLHLLLEWSGISIYWCISNDMNVSQQSDQSIINKTLMTLNGCYRKDQSTVPCLDLCQVTRHANLTILKHSTFWISQTSSLHWNVYVWFSNNFLSFFNIRTISEKKVQA